MSCSVAILGATSLVAPPLLAALQAQGLAPVALTRQAALHGQRDGVQWCSPDDLTQDIQVWVSLAPVWSLPACLPIMQRSGVRRLIALSSTSVVTKRDSHSGRDRDTAARILEGERRVEEWATAAGVEWIALRTTMIHGGGRDRNVTEIVRWIRRWRVFPLIGGGRGLRQPVHVQDVAATCARLVSAAPLPCKVLNLVGGETLSYREMVLRVAQAADVRFLFLPMPCWLARIAVRMLAWLPRYRHLTPDVADRMNKDLVFDGEHVRSLIGLWPGSFVPDGQSGDRARVSPDR